MKTKSGRGGAGAGTYIVSFVLLGVIGVGLAAILGKGKHATVPAGTLVTAFVDKDVEVGQPTVAAKQVDAQIIVHPETVKVEPATPVAATTTEPTQ